MPRAIVPDAALVNRADVLAADIPSQGTMTARGVARLYAALLGHVDGVKLISAGRLAAMAGVAYRGPDRVMGFESEWAFGYSPSRPAGNGRPGSAFGMFGMNGSAAYADIDSGVAVAVLRNRFGGAATAAAMVDRIVTTEDLTTEDGTTADLTTGIHEKGAS
jgi:CubicO group peptidase (beta-lactamase class C family)